MDNTSQDYSTPWWLRAKITGRWHRPGLSGRGNVSAHKDRHEHARTHSLLDRVAVLRVWRTLSAHDLRSSAPYKWPRDWGRHLQGAPSHRWNRHVSSPPLGHAHCTGRKRSEGNNQLSTNTPTRTNTDFETKAIQAEIYSHTRKKTCP